MSQYINEAFKKFRLLEDFEEFPLNPEGLDNLGSFMGQALDDESVDVYDLEAEAQEDLKKSYVGKVICDCNVCHSNIFYDKEDIVIDDEGIVNAEDECPYCMSTDGYTIIGEIKDWSPEVEDEIEDEPSDEELADEPIEIEDEEETEVVEENLKRKSRKRSLTESRRKSKIGLKEGKWNYTLECGNALRKAIDDEDLERVLLEIRNAYQELLAAELIDDYDYERYTEDFDMYLYDGFDTDSWDDPEEIVNYELDNLYDLCDSLRVWIPLMESLKLDGVKSLRGTKGLKKRPDKDSVKSLKGLGNSKISGTTLSEGMSSLELNRLLQLGANDHDILVELIQWLPDKTINDFIDYYNGEPDLNESSWSIDAKDLRNSFLELSNDPYAPTPFYWGVEDTDPLAKKVCDLLRKKGFTDGDNVRNWPELVVDDLTDDEMATFIAGGLEYDFDGNQYTFYESYKPLGKKKIAESIEDVTINTEDETMTMTTKEDGGVIVETSPKQSDEFYDDFDMDSDIEAGDEVIAPISDETEDEIMGNSEEDEFSDEEIFEEEPAEEEPTEEEPTEEDVEVGEFDEETFNGLGESYLRRCYDNVNGYKTSQVRVNNNTLIVEGVISFKSGAKKKTNFVFESKDMKNGKYIFEGYNAQINNGKPAFRLNCSINHKRVIPESLKYNYISKNALNESVKLTGTVKAKRK